MEGKIIKEPNWTKTLRMLEIEQHIDVHFKLENYMRSITVLIRNKHGYEYAVNRQPDGIRVTRVA